MNPPFSTDPIWSPKMQVLSVHNPQIDIAGEIFESKILWSIFPTYLISSQLLLLKSFDFEAVLGSKKLRKEFAQPNRWGDKHTLKISKLFQKILEVVKYLQKKLSQYLYNFLQYLQTV